MFQFFQNNGVVILVGVVALLMSAIACSAPAPTATSIPTPTPIPTVPPPPDDLTCKGSVRDCRGEWLLSDNRDPISDEHFISALLQDRESRASRYQIYPYISVSCVNNSVLLISIEWGEFLGFDDREVDWRVNDEPASTETWALVDDDSVYAPGVSQKLSDLLRADKITARVHREASSSLTAEWDTEGFAEVYKTVYDACKR